MGRLTGLIGGMACLSLSMMANFIGADEIMIDNFEPDSEVRWDYFSDQVMGGVSEGSARMGSDNGEA